MFKTILKQALKMPQIDAYDSYLFVGPHPDDIEVACGATVARLTQLGKQVVFVVATDGRGGTLLTDDVDSAQLIEIRQKESIMSAKILGVDNVIFLPFADGGMYDYNEMVVSLQTVILQVQPDIVITVDYLVGSECHPDHNMVGKATTHAFMNSMWRRLNDEVGLQGCSHCQAIAFYCTHRPNRYVKVGKTFDLKMQAIQCHQSQFDLQAIKTLKLYFSLRNARFGLRSWKGKAEGYRMLTNVCTHCIPEFSE